MSEVSTIQLTNFGKLLLEKGITKRQLAQHLGMHENGMIRVLSNPDIKQSRLIQIAECLNETLATLEALVYQSKLQSQQIRDAAAEKRKAMAEALVEPPAVVTADQVSDASESDSVNSATILSLLAEILNLQKQIESLLKHIAVQIISDVKKG
ncbi:hypothetical protein AGMMS4957_21760 [Bacteroidia bacterium]|nr:hypothetical protein AGMMS4957_21760 [Bacteroidia bacterium]